MLRRRTPLRTTTPLKRTRMVPRRSDTGPDPHTVTAVYERAGWSCECCTAAVGPRRGEDHHVHHRRPRAAGGSRRTDTNSPANLVLLCPPCHDEIESRRAEAQATGWLLPQTADPTQRPVLIANGSRWVYLTPDGRYATRQPEVADA